MEGLQTMTMPINGSKLQQFICALQWLKHTIPSFSETFGTIYYLMERLYDQADKLTKRAT